MKDFLLHLFWFFFYVEFSSTQLEKQYGGDRTNYRTRPAPIKRDYLECPMPNGIFPYMKDCAKFINCANGFPYLQSCGPGTLFNPRLSVCDYPYNVVCQLPVKGDLEKAKEIDTNYKEEKEKGGFEGTEGTILGGINKFVRDLALTRNQTAPTTKREYLECPNPLGVFPYVKDCSKFINCTNGFPFLQSCGPGALFNPRLLYCDYPYNVDCSIPVEGYLEKPNEKDSKKNDKNSRENTEKEVHELNKKAKEVHEGKKKEKEVHEGKKKEKEGLEGKKKENEEQEFQTSFFDGINKLTTSFGKTLKDLKKKAKEVIKVTEHGVTDKVGVVVAKGINSTYKVVDEKIWKTASSFKKSSQSLCLKPTGQFPYPKDCSKFVNCWNKRSTLQSCAPGLLFDASSSQCGWPGMVICASPAKHQDTKDKADVYPPFPGQRIRLRRGGSPYAGYLQVWSDGDWRPVIVVDENWKAKGEICRGLGFTRGAESETRGLVYGWPKERHLQHLVVMCNNEHLNPLDCPRRLSPLEGIAKSVVGIRCRRNSVSECPPNWHRWGKKCYSADVSERVTHSTAREKCRQRGARLLSIESQKENDYISFLLSSKDGNSKGFHTGGVFVRLHGESYWMWQNTQIPQSTNLTFSKWWQGWNGEENNVDSVIKSISNANDIGTLCISLHTSFPLQQHSKDLHSAQYFYWKLGKCEFKHNYVCERDFLNVGCVNGRGEAYNGIANVTVSGSPCLRWEDFKSNFGRLAKVRTLRNNFCSNPDGDDLPWCFVEGGTAEFCDIPRCPYNNQPIKNSTTSSCSTGKFSCTTGECIHLEWVCDGQKDCPHGEEEVNCPDYSDIFVKNSGMRLAGSEVEKWLFSPKPTCSIRCAQSKKFVCFSFNYEESSSTCILSNSNAGTSGGLSKDLNWEYHERVDLAPDCSQSLVCSDSKCIPPEKVCDGRRDCLEGEDEQDCIDLDKFQIRLVNGSGDHEGRVEIKVSDGWGQICDDMWGVEDGNVVCRQLGYSRGAKKTFTNSHFGSGTGGYLMDDLNCKGDEESLALCDYGGWGKSDCKQNEAAAVTCYTDKDVCLVTQWECSNGRCIDFSYYCDKIDDCGDNSDEKIDLCAAPVNLRLTEENPSFGKSLNVGPSDRSFNKETAEGRVEIQYKGLWGTICDDDVSIKEGHVICRMMGFEGAVSVFKNNSFGPGKGPVWIDGLQCAGNELSITECKHEQWGTTNCDHNEDLGIKCTNDIPKDQKEKFLPTEPPPSIPAFDIFPHKCGIRYVEDDPKELLASPRIVDGHIPRPGAHPWMAGIRRKTSLGSTHECGGFILTEDLVLTAAHCLFKYTISEYVVRTGDFNNQEKDIYEEEWLVENIIIHPEFDKHTVFNNDVGLLKIKRKDRNGIRFSERVQPICLVPKGWDYPSGLNCTVAGWGTMSSTSGYSRILQSTLLPILSDTLCRDDHVYGSTRISPGMFCAGYMEGGIDTCQGDSGGPLVCSVQGKFTAVGITSWGHGCARANKPGVYTKLSFYLDWIYNVSAMIKQ